VNVSVRVTLEQFTDLNAADTAQELYKRYGLAIRHDFWDRAHQKTAAPLWHKTLLENVNGLNCVASSSSRRLHLSILSRWPDCGTILRCTSSACFASLKTANQLRIPAVCR
jgi:hypothetical protein